MVPPPPPETRTAPVSSGLPSPVDASFPAQPPPPAPDLGAGQRNGYTHPGQPLPLLRRQRVHDQVVQCIRDLLRADGFAEVSVPGPARAGAPGDGDDATFTLDDIAVRAFPREAGQLYLEEALAAGVPAVFCERDHTLGEARSDEPQPTAFKRIDALRRGVTLDGLCDLQERVVKEVAMCVTVADLGGANITRLERMIANEHARLTYRETIGILQRRGFAIAFGSDLGPAAQAALVYHCGDLPVHLVRSPESGAFFNAKRDTRDPKLAECVDYILPFSGRTVSGSLREPDVARLRSRLQSEAMYARLMDRAAGFAHLQRASRGADETRRSRADLAARYQETIRSALEHYLSLFAGSSTERGGFSLAVARLLQYLMGLDSVREAVVQPMHRVYAVTDSVG